MRQLLFTLVLFSSSFVWAQNNIVDYLKLAESNIKVYKEGELRANDTIIDLKNGYYAEIHEDVILRQAAIFNNSDGSKLLGVSTCEWDFACFNYQTHFSKLSKIGDSIFFETQNNVLPKIKVLDFITTPATIEVLNKYLIKLQGSYLDSNATIDDLLSELYKIKYILPQKGTTILATLAVCDYIPTNEIEIIESDWEIISNNFDTIKLSYNKKSNKFQFKNN